MEVKELEIGDLVYNTYYNKVIQWNYNEMFMPNYKPVLGRDLEPIKLSDNILCMNGFKYTPLYGYTYFSYEWLYLYHRYENKFYVEIGNALKGKNIEVNHVHELQHILRFCKLNELADNFKIC